MAGGQGKRLLPMTKNCPKPMLKINGKPILEIIIEQCVEAGFREFYISVNYLKEKSSIILVMVIIGESISVILKKIIQLELQVH